MGFSVEYALPVESAVETLRNQLQNNGVDVASVTEIPYGVKLDCSLNEKSFCLVLYHNNKSPLCTKLTCNTEGPAAALVRSLAVAGAPVAAGQSFAKREALEIPDFDSHIGTDESGKGDLIGPLVTAGVFVTRRTAEMLEVLGIKDSKLSSDSQNRRFAAQLRSALDPADIEVICISPARYNDLYAKVGNLNSLLAWAHARVLENLLLRHPDCGDAIIDQFGSEYTINRALMPLGRSINVLLTPKGERDTAVAAASILARDRYLAELDSLSAEAGITLCKGAGSQADGAALMLYRRYGREKLAEYLKMHFKNVENLK